jgi:hypothetical protein
MFSALALVIQRAFIPARRPISQLILSLGLGDERCQCEVNLRRVHELLHGRSALCLHLEHRAARRRCADRVLPTVTVSVRDRKRDTARSGRTAR